MLSMFPSLLGSEQTVEQSLGLLVLLLGHRRLGGGSGLLGGCNRGDDNLLCSGSRRGYSLLSSFFNIN